MVSIRSFNKVVGALFIVIPLVILGSHRLAFVTKPQFSVPPRIEVNVNAAAPLVARLTFSADRPVRTQLLLYDGRSTKLIYETDGFAQNISLPILGLRPASKHLL